MINEKAIENIREYGVYHDTGRARNKILFEDVGLNADQKAEYVIIAGCAQPEGMPQTFLALKNIFERLQVSYTFLSKEYCCGWMPLGQPAVMAKNEEDIAESKVLAGEFVEENFRQAKSLGAKSIALFCAACEPTYSNYKDRTDLEIISYTELLDRYFLEGKLELDADYYAGCYRFRRKMTSSPLDLEPTLKILDKIEGLHVNHLDNSKCCFIPPHLENLNESIKTDTVITICTGCFYNLRKTLKDKGDYEVTMLPDLLWRSIQDSSG
ncbi:MAG: (Fe-S)-binding protein [Desulfatiglans sp.]|jgi:Fe-S oxidoreductase|nr:(Fe-S)-binding protein [Desulfatiglans sp.]